MQKLLLTILLISTGYTNSSAQNVKIGVKAGLNYANFTGSEIQTDAITSYHAGIVAEISVLDSFSIQPELLYSTQGASYENAIDEYKNELGYISLPVLLKIYLSDSFSLDVGPQASFLLNKKDEFNLNDYNTFDFSANAGLSLKITKSLFAQARYSLGLTEVSKNADAKNSVVQVSLGVLF
jgi:Outer membrane protein beta-barrel domain